MCLNARILPGDFRTEAWLTFHYASVSTAISEVHQISQRYTYLLEGRTPLGSHFRQRKKSELCKIEKTKQGIMIGLKVKHDFQYYMQ